MIRVLLLSVDLLLHLSISLPRQLLRLLRRLPRLILSIRSLIKRNKQKQITSQANNTTKSSMLFPCASSIMRHLRGIRVCEIVPRGKIYDQKIDDELSDLSCRNPFLPRAPNLQACQSVVEVHQHMNCEVETDNHPGNGGLAVELGEAEDCGC